MEGISLPESGFWMYRRLLGSWPETGFEEVGRLVPGSRLVEHDWAGGNLICLIAPGSRATRKLTRANLQGQILALDYFLFADHPGIGPSDHHKRVCCYLSSETDF